MAKKTKAKKKAPVRVADLKKKTGQRGRATAKKAAPAPSPKADPYHFVSTRKKGGTAFDRIQRAARSLLGGVQRRVSDLLGGEGGVPASKLNPELKRLRREWLKKRLTSTPRKPKAKKK